MLRKNSYLMGNRTLAAGVEGTRSTDAPQPQLGICALAYQRASDGLIPQWISLFADSN